MDLDFALLADGVVTRPDGKVDIFGAGIDTVYTASVPARHTRLALMLRFALLDDADIDRSHSLTVALKASDGRELARAGGEIEPNEESRARRDQTEWITLNVVLNFDNPVFPEFGRLSRSLRQTPIASS